MTRIVPAPAVVVLTLTNGTFWNTTQRFLSEYLALDLLLSHLKEILDLL